MNRWLSQNIDLLLSGKTAEGTIITPVAYENISVTPSIGIPVNLRSQLIGRLDSVNLQWDTVAGMQYAVYVGTAPKNGSLTAPNADLTTGVSRMLFNANTVTNNGYVLSQLKPGTYYWSVQAIDNAGRTSAFATNGQFTIGELNIPTEERNGLIAFYTATNGDSWNVATPEKKWKDTNGDFKVYGSEGNWHGVRVQDGHVVEIDLGYSGLTGTLPDMSMFTNLKKLNVAQNKGSPQNSENKAR